MFRHLAAVAASLVLLTNAAHAQALGFPTGGGTTRSTEEQMQDREIEQKYRSTVDSMPDKKPGSTDPWGNVRQAPSQAAGKPQKKQP